MSSQQCCCCKTHATYVISDKYGSRLMYSCNDHVGNIVDKYFSLKSTLRIMNLKDLTVKDINSLYTKHINDISQYVRFDY